MKQSTLIKALFASVLTMVGLVVGVRFAPATGDISQQKPGAKGTGKAEQSEPPGMGKTPLLVTSKGNELSVTHQMGTVLVPRQPERICSLAFTDELLAIGVKPAAASCMNGSFSDYLAQRLEGVVGINQLMGVAQPNFETLATVQPDLIISSSGDPQTYNQLSRIAPVVVMAGDGDNNRQRVLDLGALLGRREIAVQTVAAYDARIQQAKQVLQAKIGNRKVAFFRIFGKQFYIHGHTRGGVMLYDELELAAPGLIENSPRGFMLSPESLLQLDAEFIFVAAEANQGAQRSWSTLLSHPAWQRVPAVQTGQVYSLTDQHQWLRPGFLAKSQMLDEILHAIAPETMETDTPPASEFADRGRQ
ncbi:putative siderophore-binding lipoprotein YfiY precursor [Gimesia alba]|uniref:Putative siderophore-binding lipoprotein YfiY n=1 Tax=Gimesia alba TaxID=2527973 RepID=A0A517RDN5_9PLAN|nr:iron-siderophore ABC transporter substrate-binding protein [Gimesia alba]QDT41987.1 putative siderophore-binding lipoprotein YfiY precursor [Gimesia alba]